MNVGQSKEVTANDINSIHIIILNRFSNRGLKRLVKQTKVCYTRSVRQKGATEL